LSWNISGHFSLTGQQAFQGRSIEWTCSRFETEMSTRMVQASHEMFIAFAMAQIGFCDYRRKAVIRPYTDCDVSQI
jgi:hypothetical protein